MATHKTTLSQTQLYYKLAQNSCGLFHVFHNIQKVSPLVTSRVAEQCSHKEKRLKEAWEVKKLGNFKKFPEMVWIDGKYPADHPKQKFW